MIEYKLKDFLPAYPTIAKSEDDLFNLYEDSFYQITYDKKEFNECKLPLLEEKPLKKKGLLLHQKFISRFMALPTPNSKMLLNHDPGTGKTKASIAVALLNKEFDKKMGRTLVITRNKTLELTFITEVISLDPERYKKAEDYDLDYQQRRNKMKARVRKDFEFNTHHIMAKIVSTQSNEYIKDFYSNRTIIIDEAHNIRDIGKSGKVDVYKEINRFLHLVEGCRILLLTATPMKDRSYEIVNLMNLIVPEEESLNPNTFETEFFQDGKLINTERLKTYFAGRISYVRAMERSKKIFVGKIPPELTKFPIVECVMSNFQSKYYLEALSRDLNSDSKENEEEEEEDSKRQAFYGNSSQASLFVFPNKDWSDGTYGKEGFSLHMKETPMISSIIKKTKDGEEVKKTKKKVYTFKEEFIETISGKTQEKTLQNIYKCSTKYAYLIAKILEDKNKIMFGYTKFVRGSGAIVLGELLKLFGYSRCNGTEKDERKRFMILSGELSHANESDRLREYMNRPENKYGGFCQVIIGSKVIGEGTSLFNVRDCFIVSPHWNFTEIEQSYMRGHRAFSHEELKKEERTLSIHCLASIVPRKKWSIDRINNITDWDKFLDLSESRNRIYKKLNTEYGSLDIEMYKRSEDKDLKMGLIKRFIKEISVDCYLNRERNIRNTDIDNSRECDYQDCEYKCEGFVDYNKQIITDTYNLYYAEEEVSSIIEKIKYMFTLRNSYDFLEFRNINVMILLKALKKMIEKNYIIYNRFGMPCYLREHLNLYYLIDDISQKENFTSSFYLGSVENRGNTVLRIGNTFKTLLIDIQRNSLYDFISYIREFDFDRKKNLIISKINRLDAILQELLLELIVIKKEQGSVSNFVIKLYDHFEANIINVYDIKMSKLLKSKNILRCYNNNAWNMCEENISEKIEKYNKERKKILYKNKYIGLLACNRKETKIEFKIRKLEDGENLRTQACFSSHIPYLIKILIELNVPYDDSSLRYIRDYSELSLKNSIESTALLDGFYKTEYYKNKDKMNKQDLYKFYILLMADLVNHKSSSEKFETRENMINLPVKTLEAIYSWLNHSKQDLCDTIEEFMKKNNLMDNIEC